METLEKWWVQKYSLPSNHELFQSKTHLELLVEYMLDYFEKNPLEVHRQQDGEIQFKDTGDPLIDKWEQQLADGEEPDLNEAFTPESMDKLKKLLSKAKTQSHYFGNVSSMRDTVERIEKQAAEEDRLRKRISTFGGKY